MAGFFVKDQTLIRKDSKGPKTNVDEWKFYNKSIPEKLKSFTDDGYKIVIFR